MHIVASTNRASRRHASWAAVARMRAPVAPTGCPTEMPQPFGLSVRHLGELVVHAAAKDVCANAERAALNGLLDNSFRRLSPDEQRTNLGGRRMGQ